MTPGRPASQPAAMTRRILFRIFCSLFGALCALLTVGAVATGLGSGGPGGRLHVLLLAHGALTGAFLSAGLLGQLRRPTERVAAWQMVLVTVVVMEATGLAFRVDDPLFEIGFPVALLLTGLLHPARGRLLRPGRWTSPLLAPAALVAAVPAAMFTVHLGRQMHGLPTDQLLAVQAGCDVALTIPFVGLLAALRTTGWRVPAWSAGIVSVVLGLASATHPDELGSAGLAGGLVVALAGAGFVTLAEWEAARTPLVPAEAGPTLGEAVI
jgi:hypothetical protein